MSNITSKETEGVSVVSFNGRIVLGFESAAFRECVKSLLSNGRKKIVLNMSNVTYIDSSGLGMLVALHVSARSQSAELHLSNLGAKFKDVLQLTRLFTVFNVYSTEVEAIRGFRPAAISA
jgi:anti-sigma B factor antagonist